MASPDVTIELCGHLSVSVDGRGREGDLPGRQGRLALAHLALNRSRAVTRERLIAALWGEDASAGHGQALNVVLSKLRRALGPEVLENAGERAVQLTPAATVDLDAAQPALDTAFAARDRGDWPAVVEGAGQVAALADAGLLPGYEAPWLEEPRRRLEELGLQARELRADAGLAVGGAELAHAERAAQELVELAPFRESGYLLLMRVREAQGNLVEALRVHERLRTLLRDELGVAPGPQVQAEFERLLKAERAEPAPAPAAPPPAHSSTPPLRSSPPAAASRSSAAARSSSGCADTSSARSRAAASSCCSRASRASARRASRCSSWRPARPATRWRSTAAATPRRSCPTSRSSRRCAATSRGRRSRSRTGARSTAPSSAA